MNAYEIALTKKQEAELKEQEERRVAESNAIYNEREKIELHQIANKLLDQFDGKGFKRDGYSLINYQKLLMNEKKLWPNFGLNGKLVVLKEKQILVVIGITVIVIE